MGKKYRQLSTESRVGTLVGTTVVGADVGTVVETDVGIVVETQVGAVVGSGLGSINVKLTLIRLRTNR